MHIDCSEGEQGIPIGLRLENLQLVSFSCLLALLTYMFYQIFPERKKDKRQIIILANPERKLMSPTYAGSFLGAGV